MTGEFDPLDVKKVSESQKCAQSVLSSNERHSFGITQTLAVTIPSVIIEASGTNSSQPGKRTPEDMVCSHPLTSQCTRGTQRRFSPKCIENTFQAIQSTFRPLEIHSNRR